jgi:dynein heavy chain
VHWTSEVEEAFLKGIEGIIAYRAFLQEQLDLTVELVRQKLTKNETITINALIVIDVHARDVIGTLRDEKVSIWQP